MIRKTARRGEKDEKGTFSYPSPRQWNQSGSVEFTIKVVLGNSVIMEDIMTGMMPESKPPDLGAQGVPNVHCVAEWFLGPGMKRNLIVSPMVAWTCAGSNMGRSPPTLT